MSATPPTPHNPAPPHYPGSGGRVGHRLRPAAIAAIIIAVILIAAAVTAAIVLSGTTKRPEPPELLPSSHAAMAAPGESDVSRQPDRAGAFVHTPAAERGVAILLTSADPITIADGISITPAPGWTVTDRGANSVTLYDAGNVSRMQVTVKPASGTDVAAVLQADINRLTSAPSTGLTNVVNLSAPMTKTLQSAKFQQQSSIDYTAQISTQQGTLPILGVFDELLNASNHQSAFIDFRQSGGGPLESVRDAGTMLRSML
jgi:hypothetical protein